MSAPLKIATLLLALATVATPAMAAPRDHDHDRGHDRHDRYDRGDYRRDGYRHDGYRHGYRDGYRDGRPVLRFRDHREPRVVYRPAPYYYRPGPVIVRRGPPPWARGVRYYGPGYGPTYVVEDWYGYGLRRPPPGYYWRRSDAGDFLLVAVATGIIADLILSH